jgi:very-short-patch-repair endonuclease
MADQRARQLRASATEAERVLWFALRPLKVKGLHFRRQAPLGRYHVDFVCHSAKLIVELDGSRHAEPEQAAHDAARTEFLQSRGCCVLRFWNADVMKSRDDIVDTILAAISRLPGVCSRT